MRKFSSLIKNEVSMTKFAKMQKKNMIFRMIFRTKQILPREIGGGGQRKHENGVRWGGWRLQRPKKA